MGMFRFYSGPAMNLTSLNMMDGTTISNCILRCNEQTGCSAVKVVDAGDNGSVWCQLYKEFDGISVVQEINLYVKE